MKRGFVVFITIALIAGALQAAPKPCATVVRHTLEQAIQNEREAEARYKAFAAKAVEEGQDGAARLFRAAAYAEHVHVRRFETALKERDIPIPPVPEFKFTVGETAANLRNAAASETGERDGTYREAIHTCDQVGDKDVKTLFDQTRDVEAEHANLFNSASRTLSSKTSKTFYVCDRCGFTSDLDLQFCVLCRTREHPREVD